MQGPGEIQRRAARHSQVTLAVKSDRPGLAVSAGGPWVSHFISPSLSLFTYMTPILKPTTRHSARGLNVLPYVRRLARARQTLLRLAEPED